MTAVSMRSILVPSTFIRLILGWGAFLALVASGDALRENPSSVAQISTLGMIIAVIIVCAMGVVHEAEHIAHRVGNPYGALVLTLTIALIEVILIATVMLGPGEHDTVARDSLMGASIIVLGLVTGLAFLVGGLRYRSFTLNTNGASMYVSMLTVLLVAAFATPAFLGAGGAYTPLQAGVMAVLIMLLYGFFLVRQLGAQQGDFREVAERATSANAGGTHPGIRTVVRTHRAELSVRLAVLVLTLLPIVLLAHDMASFLDSTVRIVSAPSTLSGVIIALIVFLPEGITTIRAAWQGEAQRVSNLAHGALVSCLGLTLPVVLLIGLFTGHGVVLAESPLNLLLLGAGVILTISTMKAKTISPVHGAAHLVLFAVYVLNLVS